MIPGLRAALAAGVGLLVVLPAVVAGCTGAGARGPAGDRSTDTVHALAAVAETAQARGLFALSSGTRPVPQRVLNEVGISGVSLRSSWADIEAQEGTFTWPFDAEIDRARQAGRTVMLRVVPGHRTPQWVYDAGAAKFEFVDTNPYRRNRLEPLTIPVPWDPVFLAKWTQFIRVMGERYAGNGTVVLVHMAGPAKTSAEMHLPKTAADKEQWKRIGYTPERLAQAWKTVVAAYAQAFPGPCLALNVARPIYDDYVLEDVVAAAQTLLGRRLCVQHNALAAKTNVSWAIHQLVVSHRTRGPIGFQMLAAAGPRLGGPLADALAIGLSAGASYFEVYAADVDDPVSVLAIRDAAAQLQAPGAR